jgi:MFS family permease
MTEPANSPRPTRVLTGPVLSVMIINLVFFSGYLFFFPTLPFFIEKLGGRESEIGLLIGISSLTSLACRPFVGYFVDRSGRRPVLITGMLIFVVNCALYNVVTTPAAILPLRLLTGASLATVITAASTYIADVAPPSQRGQVLSYFALSNAVGFAIGPALGGYIIHADVFNGFDSFFTDRLDWLSGARTGDLNFTTMFIVATLIGLVGTLLAWRIPESKPDTAPPPRRPGPRDLFAREAALPAAVNFATAFSFAGMVTFLPLFARDVGLNNPGSLFIAYAVAVIVMRFTVGPFMDRVSRATVIIPGIGALVATMLVIVATENVFMLFVAASLWGVGTGVFQPAMMAFAVDRTPPAVRGRAMGTFTMGMDLGISLGSLILGIVVEAWGFRPAYTLGAIVVALGLVLFAWSWFRSPPEARNPQTASPGA